MKTLTTEAALRTIASIDYDGVEPALMPGWPTDPAQMSAADRKTLRRLIGDLGLAVPAMLESLPLQGTPKSRAANLERLKRAVALGNELVPSSPPMVDTILGGKTVDWERRQRADGRRIERLGESRGGRPDHGVLQAARRRRRPIAGSCFVVSPGGRQSADPHRLRLQSFLRGRAFRWSPA